MRWISRAFLTLAVLTVAALAGIKFFYGRGAPYPGFSTPPLRPESALQSLAQLDFPPGNVTVSGEGRVFFNYHPFAGARRFADATLFELVSGKPQPYPSPEFQSQLQGVFGLTVDRQNRLWIVEPASLDHERTRLMAFDLKTGSVAFDFWFPTGEARFAQDLRISPDGKTAYLADTGLFKFTRPALIVFDIATQQYRQLMSHDPAAQPQDWIIRTPFGPHKLGWGLVTFAVGLDGIALSDDGEWLYVAAMSNDTLYRMRTDDLLDLNLSADDIYKRVEKLGNKPLSDGITLDQAGNVILTDIENGGLMRKAPDGKLATLVKSSKIIWADGVVMAPDQALLFTDSAIPAYIDQLARPPSLETLTEHRPYAIYRLPPPP
jgi:sugar lactone lactonase YvrE